MASTPRPLKHNRVLQITLLALVIFISACLQACAPSAEEQFQILKENGDVFFKTHKYKLAIQEWEKALLVPDIGPSPRLYIQLAEAYSRRASPNKAYNALTKGLTNNPAAPQILLGIAQLQLNFAEINKAESSWQNSIKDMQTAESYIFQGDLYSIKGALQPAEDAYLSALTIDKNNVQALARLAICQLGLQKEEQATGTYAQLTNLSPQKPSTLYQMGNFWRIKKDFPQTEHFFRQSCSKDPGNLVLKRNLAEYYLSRNSLAKARSIVTDALGEEPDTAFFDKLHIEILLRLKKSKQALQELEKLADKGSLDVEMYMLKGKYFLLEQKPNFAISQFSEAIKKEPALPLSHYFLAVSYFANNNTNLAKQSAIKALSLNPYFTDAELLLANIFYKKKDYDTAEEHVMRIMRREPENPRPYMLSGAINLERHDYEKALNYFKKAQIVNPGHLAPIFFYALTKEKTGDIPHAKKIYHQLITQQPEYTGIAARYSSILQRQGEQKNAIDFLQKIANQSAHAAEYNEIIGLALLSSGKKAKGVSHLRKAIEINRHQYSSYLHLADYYEKHDMWQEFSEILSTCLELQPANIEAIVKLADYYMNNNSAAQALAIIDRGLQQKPKSPILANSKAWILLETGEDINQAFILARKAYDQNPENPAIADTLGWSYFHKKMYTRAQWLLEEAQLKAPDESIIKYHLALVFMATDKKDVAKKLLIQSLEMGLGKRPKTTAETILKEL